MKQKMMDMRGLPWGFVPNSHMGVEQDGEWALWFADDYSIDLLQDGEDLFLTALSDDEIIMIHVTKEDRAQGG